MRHFHPSINPLYQCTLHMCSPRTLSFPASDPLVEGPMWQARRQDPQYSTSQQLLHLVQTLESRVQTQYFILLREKSKSPQNPPAALPTVLKGALQVASQLLRGQRLGCCQQKVQHRPMCLSHVINDIGIPRLYVYLREQTLYTFTEEKNDGKEGVIEAELTYAVSSNPRGGSCGACFMKPRHMSLQKVL